MSEINVFQCQEMHCSLSSNFTIASPITIERIFYSHCLGTYFTHFQVGFYHLNAACTPVVSLGYSYSCSDRKCLRHYSVCTFVCFIFNFKQKHIFPTNEEGKKHYCNTLENDCETYRQTNKKLQANFYSAIYQILNYYTVACYQCSFHSSCSPTHTLTHKTLQMNSLNGN